MAVLNIPNTIANNTKANATKLNENFDAIEEVVNGNLDDTNIDEITEAVIVFSDSGHSHSGGDDGVKIDISDIDGAITHDVLPFAVDNSTKGAVYFESGETDTIADNGYEEITLTNIGTLISMPFVYDSTNNTTAGFADPDTGFMINYITANSFRIYNYTGGSLKFKWRCVGIE